MVSSLLWIMLTIASAAGQSGWLDVHAPDANLRLDVLLNQSEDIGQMEPARQQSTTSNQPSHMTYQRVDGGIGP